MRMTLRRFSSVRNDGSPMFSPWRRTRGEAPAHRLSQNRRPRRLPAKQGSCLPAYPAGMQAKDGPKQERQELELFQAAELLLEECRMVLPGIQSLFGFQLIAVFSDGFHQRLSGYEQDLHLGAIALIGVAIALIMTPAAVHRQLDPC